MASENQCFHHGAIDLIPVFTITTNGKGLVYGVLFSYINGLRPKKLPFPFGTVKENRLKKQQKPASPVLCLK
jgi:hypothetical protein